MIVNESNFSAAETFPLMFKIAEAGTIVGRRTGGGGTGGALDYPALIDGGRIVIPNRASYNPKTREWAENRGVEPDVDVTNWPAEWRAGKDAQLERAVEIALKEIESGNRETIRRPSYPVHP